MPAALLLAQDVHLGLELGVGSDALGRGQHLTPLHLLLVDAAQKGADVVAGLSPVEDLAEHLDTGAGRLLGRSQADDLDLVAGLDHTLLDAAGHHRAAPGDGEHVLDRHQERLVDVAVGSGHVGVHCLHELEDLLGRLLVAVEGLQGRHPDHRRVVTGELVLVEQLAHLELDQLEDLLVVDHVHLVEGHHDAGDAHLAGQQHVLPGLGHGAVGGRDHQDGAVHLGGAGDHVLDVVGVTRHVDVGVVPVAGLVLHVGDVDGDATLALLGGIVDLVELGELGPLDALGQHLGDGGCQRGLAVVDVAHRPHVDVRLGPLELLLGHGCFLLWSVG